ncbi:FAD:protein FMN transferase [Carnobacteriaceae bacterium 52-44]
MRLFKQNKKSLFVLFLSFIAFIIVACGNEEEANQEPEPTLLEEPIERREFLMGTYVVLRVYDEGQEEALDEAIARVEELDEKLASNRSSSEIGAINEAAGEAPVEVSDDVFPLIEVAEEYSAIPNSGFDYTIGPITDLWRIGFDDARVPEPEEIEAVLPLVNHEKAELNAEDRTVFLTEEGMRIDLGAIAKGYIADEVINVLKEHRVTTAIVDLGGNVVIMGDSPTRDTDGFNVGVQNPDSTRGEIVGSINLKDKSIVTSGIYERFIEENGEFYHHLMSPDTGYPFDNDLAGVTIITDKSVDGDALSTVVYAFGLEGGLDYVNNQEGIDAVFVTHDQEVYTSDGITEGFNLTDDSYTWVNQ